MLRVFSLFPQINSQYVASCQLHYSLRTDPSLPSAFAEFHFSRLAEYLNRSKVQFNSMHPVRFRFGQRAPTTHPSNPRRAARWSLLLRG